MVQLRGELVPAAHFETLRDEPEVLREGLERAHLVPDLELVDLVRDASARLGVLDDDLKPRKLRPLLLGELGDGLQVPIGVEEGADVGEGDAPVFLEDLVSGLQEQAVDVLRL